MHKVSYEDVFASFKRNVPEINASTELVLGSLFRCSRCGCILDDVEEFEEHLKISHPTLSQKFTRFARQVLNLSKRD